MKLFQLTTHLWVYTGHINVGVLVDGRRSLLIDYDGSILDGTLAATGAETVDTILLTHCHRDQYIGIHDAIGTGACVAASEAERCWLTNPDIYWNDPKFRWHIYSFRPGRLMPVDAVPVTRGLNDGDRFIWGSAKIQVIAAPGHTDGSLSYIVETDGKRIAFTGDLIYRPGQLWDLYSLQKGSETTIDYHGFMGAQRELAASIETVLEAKPEVLVPSHGQIINEPEPAADLLANRIRRCYGGYAAISALHHYFPTIVADTALKGTIAEIPMRRSPALTVPDCLRHIETTWVLISETGAAYVMDCGNISVAKKLREMLSKGEISSVEGLWITHYHDDHVDGIEEFRKTFDCVLTADSSVAKVITSPLSWKLPCISPVKVRIDIVTADGESWQWHEFKMTAYHLPGQSMHHGGLLVEGQGKRMLFAGDSFTPTGIDDYCPQNRNLLGPGLGFQRCISLVKAIKPDYIFNPHVDSAFTFDGDQLDFMVSNLIARESTVGELIPWDNANYGLDDSWAFCFPYEQQAEPGTAVTIDVVVTNHSPVDRRIICRARFPKKWNSGDPGTTVESELCIGSKSTGRVPLEFAVPTEIKAGRYPVVVDIELGEIYLPAFTEAIVDIIAP